MFVTPPGSPIHKIRQGDMFGRERKNRPPEIFDASVRGIVEGERLPLFTHHPQKGEMERGMIASLMGGRAPDRDPRTSPRGSTCSEASLLSFLRFFTVDCVFFKKTVFLWQELRSNQSVIFLSINPFLKMVIPPPLWETTIPTVLVT